MIQWSRNTRQSNESVVLSEEVAVALRIREDL